MFDQMNAALTELLNHYGVRLAIVVSRDGFLLGAQGLAEYDSEMAAAVSAVVAGMSQVQGENLGFGSAQQLVIDFHKGTVMIFHLAEAYLLVVIDKKATIGHIREVIKSLAGQLHRIISLPGPESETAAFGFTSSFIR